MFDEKYKAEVDRLCNQFADWQRGSVIPWTAIEQLMGRSREDRGGWTIIRAFRKRLLRDREIVTLPKDSVGLRLLTDQEAAREIPVLRQRKAYRQLNRALRETAAITPDRLPDRLRLALVAQRRQMRDHRRAIGRSHREACLLGRATPTHPVRKLTVVG